MQENNLQTKMLFYQFLEQTKVHTTGILIIFCIQSQFHLNSVVSRPKTIVEDNLQQIPYETQFQKFVCKL
jgi:hypothetical protein